MGSGEPWPCRRFLTRHCIKWRRRMGTDSDVSFLGGVTYAFSYVFRKVGCSYGLTQIADVVFLPNIGKLYKALPSAGGVRSSSSSGGGRP
jgi:hypothetical protein